MQDRTVVFLGAGFSVPANIPVQSRILEEMVKPPVSFSSWMEQESKKFLYAYIDIGLFLLKRYTNVDVERLENKKIELSYLKRLLFLTQDKDINEKKNAFQSVVSSLADKSIERYFINTLMNLDGNIRIILDAQIYRILVDLKEAIRLELEKSQINVDLEDIFTMFDKSLKEQHNWESYTYDELDCLRHSLLRLFTYYFGKNIRSFHGRKYKAYASFASFCNSSNVSIITTNWDLILEKVFKKYGINYCVINSSQNTTDNIPVFKLHGSIDWLHCNNCSHLEIIEEEEVGDFLFDDNKEACCKYCMQTEEGNKVLLRPDIITPTMLKTVDNDLYGNLWKEAEKELRIAKRIVFVGYSLPLADFEIRYLLKKNIKQDVKIDVILASHDRPQKRHYKLSSECRYKSVFSTHEVNFYYEGFDKYFSNL